MLSASQRHLTLLAFFLVAPGLGLASTVDLNGTYQAGNTTQGDPVLTGGTSVSLTPFGFTYVAGDGDWYAITGNYAASESAAGGTSLTFNVDATYEGNGGINSTPSAGADTLTFDDYQDFNLAGTTYYTDHGTIDGYYDEYTGSSITAVGGTLSAEAFYNTVGLGELGPFGVGSNYQAIDNVHLTTLTGSVLDEDFKYTFKFASGTTPGGYIDTPEPGGLIPVAAILALCLGIPAIRRSRLFSKNLG
jgi:hypothetical protein